MSVGPRIEGGMKALLVGITVFMAVLTLSCGFVNPPSGGNYTGFKVIQAHVTTVEHLGLVNSFKEVDGVDIWVLPHAFPCNVSIIITEQQFDDVTLQMDSSQLRFTLVSRDFQSAIAKERRRAEQRGRRAHYDIGAFNSYEKMDAYMRKVCRETPYCRLFYVGTSYEGRIMHAVKFSTSSSSTQNPGIWIDAGIHAREWLAPATAMYVIHSFAEAIRSKDLTLLSMLDDYDWYFMPCINPDGYEYSRDHDRLWRKTRSRHHGDQGCVGVDSNRNWDFHWMEIGASADPCSPIYAGPHSFSEPETRAVRDFLLTYKSSMVAYISFHSYGQYLLHPWGYTSDLPADHEQLMFVLDHVAEAIQSSTGKHYTLGSSTNVLYEAAGGSDDWAKAVAGIQFSFTFELRDLGYHGFLVPEAEIGESGREMHTALVELQNAITELRRRR